jgi:hypothetical protein
MSVVKYAGTKVTAYGKEEKEYDNYAVWGGGYGNYDV